MKHSELIGTIAKNRGIAKNVVQQVLEGLVDALVADVAVNGGTKLHGVAHFSIKTRAARLGRNPATGEQIEIPTRDVVVIKPAKAFTDRVFD